MFQFPMFLIILFGVHLSDWVQGGGGDQDWGHITVRPQAHMFWWLYYTAAPVSHYTERPLIIWLQGGPGMPSSGYGNFIEIGPETVHFKRRDDAFTAHCNVLFVDNPVGVGFSYFAGPNAQMQFVRNGTETGRDLVEFLNGFLALKPEFLRTSIYVFGESYGGKMAVEFVYELLRQSDPIRRSKVKIAGIGLGDAYISPVHYLQHYGPLALELGLVDRQGYYTIQNLSLEIRGLIEKGDFAGAADIESRMTDAFTTEMSGLDIYNILVETNTTRLPRFMEHMDDLETILNRNVKRDLDLNGLNVTWTFFRNDIHQALKGDLLRPVTDKIECLLNTTDIKIIVYNGNLDFIVNTAGTISWLDELQWRQKGAWTKGRFVPLELNMVYEGYYKSVGNLVFYAILRAGHSVPVDNMAAMQEILQREILSNHPNGN